MRRTVQLVLVILALCAAAAGVVAAHTGGYLTSTFDLLLSSSDGPKILPIPNKDSKRDRMPSDLRLRLPDTPDDSATQLVTHSLETAMSYLGAPAAARPEASRAAPVRPAKATNVLLNDATLASMKSRLRLSRSQERYWPPVETALRVVVAKIYDASRRYPTGGLPPIDVDSDEIQQLRNAVGPFIKQLNETQKNEVRALARIVGLEKTIFSL